MATNSALNVNQTAIYDRRPNSDTRRLRTTTQGFSAFFAALKIGRFEKDAKDPQGRSFRRPLGFSPLRPAAVSPAKKAAAQVASELPQKQQQTTIQQKVKQRSQKMVSLSAISSMPSRIPKPVSSRTALMVPEARSTSSSRGIRGLMLKALLQRRGLQSCCK
ncbi:hypothetical protein CLOM_g21006 [Closterium sp. NIES-68]|nr:hypothetical protein CLOM_g21006 [Closterium sp. NIES-68]GJP60804.1 hypothetical protein CLOP_g18024 [Closterium sp. NIES-67]GJP61339.1 hypothetical protein CLOP_g18510 [Closterium sp. NIES-67]GJP70904.1 hypothetical protein CLOP_g1794 [Closterium sp. NIES-67]